MRSQPARVNCGDCKADVAVNFRYDPDTAVGWYYCPAHRDDVTVGLDAYTISTLTHPTRQARP